MLLLVFTGGTISMKIDPRLRAAVPVLSGREIVDLVPGLNELAEYQIVDFARLAGPQMTPSKMFELSDLLIRELARPEITGAVVTHGTDTLEETAYLLDLRLTTDKPIVVTGALRNGSELGWDGPANLYSAARTALDECAPKQGVFVVLNDTVHAASEVTKADTQSLGAFQSPIFGPLAIVEKDGLFWRRRLLQRQTITAKTYEPRVDLIKVVAGSDGHLLECAATAGAAGIVIEGTGRGNVPPSMLPSIQKVLDAGVTVVIASRCFAGRVLDTYGYEGSGQDLRRRGCVFAGILPGQKARIKLMLALGQTRDRDHLRALFEADGYRC